MPALSNLFSALLLVFLTVNCAHMGSKKEINTQSKRFNEFEKAFYRLAEVELSRNKEASKPEVKIIQILEGKNELKIKYSLKYNESFSDGEFIERHTIGTALLKKNLSSSEEEWVLDGIEGANQSMIFKRGSKLGS